MDSVDSEGRGSGRARSTGSVRVALATADPDLLEPLQRARTTFLAAARPPSLTVLAPVVLDLVHPADPTLYQADLLVLDGHGCRAGGEYFLASHSPRTPVAGRRAPLEDVLLALDPRNAMVGACWAAADEGLAAARRTSVDYYWASVDETRTTCGAGMVWVVLEALATELVGRRRPGRDVVTMALRDAHRQLQRSEGVDLPPDVRPPGRAALHRKVQTAGMRLLSLKAARGDRAA